MTRTFFVVLLSAVAATAMAGVVEVAPERGHAVASINWIDDFGRPRALAELAGYPVILLPIYTRCRTACVRNVERLKETLASSSDDPPQFRVLLFSFDPNDTPATLVKYRERELIPLSWSIGVASQDNIDALLDSIGGQVGKAGTEFTHPNLLVFLDSNLRVAKWIYGTDYTAADVGLALKVARGQNDWIGQYSQLLYALLLFGVSILCVVLGYHVAELRRLRGANSMPQA